MVEIRVFLYFVKEGKNKLEVDVDVDETCFFSGIINGRMQRNRINGLLIHGNRIMDPDKIKDEWNFFFLVQI